MLTFTRFSFADTRFSFAKPRFPTHVTAYDDDESDTTVELYFTSDMAKLWLASRNDNTPIEADQFLVVSIERCHNVKTVSDTVKLKGVIKREFDNLSKGETKTHQKQVDQAKLEEL